MATQSLWPCLLASSKAVMLSKVGTPSQEQPQAFHVPVHSGYVKWKGSVLLVHLRSIHTWIIEEHLHALDVP
eukprot:5226819-Amphidinium_carterae.1